MANDGQLYVMQEKARAPFLTVVTPTKVGIKGREKGDPIYSATVLLEADGPDSKALKAALTAIAKAAFPGRPLSELKFPIVSGDVEADKSVEKGKDGSFFRGKLVLKATSNQDNPPALGAIGEGSVRELSGAQREIEGKRLFYNGCHVLLALYLAPYRSGKDGGIGEFSGVKAYLNQVVWAGDGPRIGGSSVTETFKHYAGTVTAADPYKDEVPF
ncbi:MAG: DUF2815 family protein [Patescibacteria group bacterium]|nr:DUF2815 family protein [Patescibacteria group bacterium]